MEPITIEQMLRTIPAQDIKRLVYAPYDLNVAVKAFRVLGEKRIRRFDIDKDNRFVIENLIRWAHGDSTMKAIDCNTGDIIQGDTSRGIYIAGPTGTGKSLLFEVLSSYLTIDDVKAVFGNNIRMLAFPYYTTSRVCRIYEERGELFHFIDCPVICFQDLGSESEQRETMFMGTRTKVMQTIIQERSDARGNITFFSSNNSITDSDTLELYGDRIVSRLKKMCNYFELKGKDRRTNDVKGI